MQILEELDSDEPVSSSPDSSQLRRADVETEETSESKASTETNRKIHLSHIRRGDLPKAEYGIWLMEKMTELGSMS